MARNANYKEDMLTIFFIGVSLVMSIVAWVGLGHWVGFFNETGDQHTFDVGGLENFMVGPVKRYIHLAIIPTVLGTIVIASERLPIFGRIIKRRNPLNPIILSMSAAIFLTIQVVPAVLGLSRNDEPISITWFSDYIMTERGGYVVLGIAFVFSIIAGFYYMILSWLKTRGNNPNVSEDAMITFGIILISVFSFIGFGQFQGFNAEFGVTSFDEYVAKYGWIKFITEGPLKRYSHLIAIPGLIGLMLMFFGKLPVLGKKIENLGTKKKKSKKGKRTTITYDKQNIRLSTIALFIMLIQLLPAFMGIPKTESGTWLSDLLMEPWGYGTFGVVYVGSSIFGLFKGLTGGVFEKGSIIGSG